MIITAKFASVCPVCSQRIAVGGRVEWSKGDKARHAACAGATAAVSAPVAAPSASRYWVRPAARQGAQRGGRWNGCSCGAREMADGALSANACASCRYDAE